MTTTPVAPVLLTLPQLCEMLNVNRSTIFRWRQQGRFPEPLQLATQSPRWRRADIDAWLDSCGAPAA